MQKKLIALAVAAGFAAPAFADNVTIYGVLDAGLIQVSAENAKYRGIHDGILSSNRLGFKGSEDLGNGLSAIFLMEAAVDGDNGASFNMGDRNIWVGLDSKKLGSLKLGRNYSPGFGASVRVDAQGAAVWSPLLRMAASTSGNGSTLIQGTSGSRLSNSALYTSPRFNGFEVQTSYQFGEEATTNNTSYSNRWDVGVNYANGALNLDFVHASRNQTSGAANNSVDEYLMGGSYNFGFLKLLASYQDLDSNTAGGDVEIWNMGVVVPVGKGNIHFSYADRDDEGAANDGKSWALAYTHGLSKRTTIYTGIGKISNDSGVTHSYGLATGTAGKDETVFTVGMRHTF